MSATTKAPASRRIANFFTETKEKINSAWEIINKNPMCGINLQRGVKILAVLQMILALVIAILPIRSFIVTRLSWAEGGAWNDLLIIGWLTSGIICLILYALLYKGVKNSNLVLVKWCWNFMAFLAMVLVALIIALVHAIGDFILLDLSMAAIFILDLYTLWVTHLYKIELKKEDAMKSVKATTTSGNGESLEMVVTLNNSARDLL